MKILVNGKVVESRHVPRRTHGLGDRIAAIATPIARALGMPCIDKETNQLKPESLCGKAKARLNAGEPIIPTIIKRIQGK